MRGLEGFSWIDGERVAIGSIPVGGAVERLPELGVTHVVNCRAPLQTRISQDLWAEREVFGEDHVMSAPMWDHGRHQPPRLWAPAARFAAAVLRLRLHDPSEAARLVLSSRAPARLVPAYRASVEEWLAALDEPLP
jgi:hypothetical protein